MELPQRYQQLKYKLYRLVTYNEEDRLLKRKRYFNEIYEHYYADLPEEEQLAIDVQQATMEVYLKEEADFGEGILHDYFSQITNKTEYTNNDLLIIELYFHCIHFKNYDDTLFMTLLDHVIDQIAHSIDTTLLLLHKLLLLAASVFMEYDNYDRLKSVVNASNDIMKKSQDFQKKPVINLLEGKYWLFAQKDKIKAQQKYEDGAQCAQLFGDFVLSDKIMAEWVLDLEKFQLES